MLAMVKTKLRAGNGLPMFKRGVNRAWPGRWRQMNRGGVYESQGWLKVQLPYWVIKSTRLAGVGIGPHAIVEATTS